ncbi:tetratricopeptide repeat protein [Kordiimonas marina]|uniref:tetratricopeptide repeat protein n=1 Tax=Kordiimonas marina TaxID=2872312 RepID=UPI001FF3F223|nr:tetratricopeptide repeat protein [Kordiimonas marina]MCJ9428508.1 sel1 repeat family protein [Kordiimonas marina]
MKPALAFCVALMLSGCANLGGLVCSTRSDGSQIADLKADSCRGNRQSAFALGWAYETGKGVEKDEKLAVRYYKQAAAASSGQTYIYVPPAGDVAGYTMPVNSGPASPGLAEAQYRLGLMYRDGRGARVNLSRARKYLGMAAKQGHPDAAKALADLAAH